MKAFFGVDGPIYKFFVRLWQVIVINFLWLICSLPIVTIGPATTAAYVVLLKIVENEEGYLVRTFFKAFKENFRQALVVGIIEIFALAAIVLDFIMADKGYLLGMDYPFLFIIMGIIASVLVFGLFIYVYPLLARYENKILLTIRNSGRISMMYFGRTLLLAVLVAIEVLIMDWNEITLIVGAIIGPGTIMLTISGIAIRIFKKIEKDGGAIQKKTEEDLFNEEIEKEAEAEMKKERDKKNNLTPVDDSHK